MTSSSVRPHPAVLSWGALRAPGAELVIQVGLVGGAWVAVELLAGRDVPGRAAGMIAFAAAAATSVLLAVGAGISDNRRARRVAGAVAIYALVVLLPPAFGAAAPAAVWALACSVAVLGVVGLLVLAVRASSDRRGDQLTAVAVLVTVAVGTGAVAGAGVLAGRVPSPAVVAAADLVAWSGTAAAALVLLLAGTVADRALLRRTGLAFATLACAHAARIGAIDGLDDRSPWAAALQLGAIAMLLVAAVPFLLDALRVASHQQERLAEAEHAGEQRRLVPDRSGPAEMPTGAAETAGDHPPAAAGTALLGGGPVLDGAAPPARAEAAVGAVLRDLALVYRAYGLDVSVDVDGDPWVAVDGGVLAQVLTNLLVNCAHHAPGARVRLVAARTGARVRVEVTDDGPGLPAGSTAALLRPGVRGSGASGEGLGLAVSAELVQGHRGTFTVVSGEHGCRVVLELPAADVGAALERAGV